MAIPRVAAGSREGPRRGWGGSAGAKARRPGQTLPPTRSGVVRSVPSPSRELPPRATPGPAEGATAGLGGAARARPPGRGSPRASTCRGARGAGSPADAFIAAAAAAAAAAASSFLLRRPLLGLGGGLRAPSLAGPGAPGGGRPRRRRRRPRRWWQRRGPGNFAPLCAPPRRRRAGRCSRCLSGSGVGEGRREAWGARPRGRGRRGAGRRGRYFVAGDGAGGATGHRVAEPGGGDGAGRGRRSRRSRAAEAPEQRSPSGGARAARAEPERAPLPAPPRRSGPPSPDWRGARGAAGRPARAIPHATPSQAAPAPGAPGQPRRVQLSANFILKALLGWGGPGDLERGVCVGIWVKRSRPVGVGQRTTFLQITLTATFDESPRFPELPIRPSASSPDRAWVLVRPARGSGQNFIERARLFPPFSLCPAAAGKGNT